LIPVTATPRWRGAHQAISLPVLRAVFVALAFIGVPPPVMQSLKPEQQEQGETSKKGE
jgi:hypothetical protein